MSTITTDDVQRLAQLSSLELSDAEVQDLQVDISNILSYIEQLATIDTAGVEPTYQVTGLSNVWRDDVVKDTTITRETLLSLAPDVADHSVKVPKVL